jgi:hypothetical protein
MGREFLVKRRLYYRTVGSTNCSPAEPFRGLV